MSTTEEHLAALPEGATASFTNGKWRVQLNHNLAGEGKTIPYAIKMASAVWHHPDPERPHIRILVDQSGEPIEPEA